MFKFEFQSIQKGSLLVDGQTLLLEKPSNPMTGYSSETSGTSFLFDSEVEETFYAEPMSAKLPVWHDYLKAC